MPHLSVLLDSLERRSKGLVLTAGSGLLLGVMVLASHAAAGSFATLLYVAPVFIVTWVAGLRVGAGFSLLGAIGHFVAESLTGPLGPPPASRLFNAFALLGVLLVLSLTVAKLKTTLDQARSLAVTDSLTGAANRRAFYHRAELEAVRSRRSRTALTLAYLDLDNFKDVNDRFGHAAGDEVLVLVAGTLRRALRASDFMARIGGDEFAIILPDTGGDSGGLVMEKIRGELLGALQAAGITVTVSLGAVTFPVALESVDEMVRAVDAQLYDVKRSGKNRIKSGVHPVLPPAPWLATA